MDGLEGKQVEMVVCSWVDLGAWGAAARGGLCDGMIQSGAAEFWTKLSLLGDF